MEETPRDASQETSEQTSQTQPRRILADFIRSFLTPTLIGKGFVMYFGLNYSMYPGEGYGYGLTISIAFTLTTLFIFIWRYRNFEDL